MKMLENYLHQGIAARNFERKFQLADHIEITGAQLANGLLHIDLAREIPEAMKPKTIPINEGKGRLMDVSRENKIELFCRSDVNKIEEIKKAIAAGPVPDA